MNSLSPSSRYRFAWQNPALLFLLALWLRLFRLEQESLWADEFFTLVLASGASLKSVFTHVVQSEPHPPLYYMLMHLWIELAGGSPFSLRLPSALAGACAAPLEYALMRALFPKHRTVAILAGLMMVIAPFNIWYSQEARAYAIQMSIELAALGTIALGLRRSGAAFYAERRGMVSWLYAGCLLAGLLMWIHYYSVFVCLTIGIIIFAYCFKRLPWRVWLAPLLAMALVALLPALWMIGVRLFVTGSAAANYIDRYSFLPARYGPSLFFYAARAQWLSPIWTPLPTGVQWFGVLLGIAMALAGAMQIRPRKKQDDTSDALPWIILYAGMGITFLLPLLVSLVRPITFWGQRYEIIGLPFTVALCAAATIQRRRFSRFCAYTGCLILGILQVCWLIPHFLHREKHPWDSVAAEIDRRAAPGELVVVVPGHSAGVLQYYLKRSIKLVGVENAVQLSEAVATGKERFMVVSYVDLTGWLKFYGASGRFKRSLFETHAPGQALWLMEYPKPD